MNTGYQTSTGILLSEEIKTIPKKSKNPLQPLLEALINSFEAIKKLEKGEIFICFNIHKDLFTEEDGKSQTEKYYFNNLTISDNGIGFNEEEFSRIFTLRDNTKNMNNKGTGRVQFLHYFKESHFNSVYKDKNSSTKYKNCEFILSKAIQFLKNNAIILVIKDEETTSKNIGTTITFTEPLDDKDYDYYARITPEEIKYQCIRYFLMFFCQNSAKMPSIEIKRNIDGIESKTFITADDIPKPKHSEPIEITYSTLENNQIVSSAKKETFTITVFLIEDSNLLSTNNIILTSKGAEATKYNIDCLLPTEKIDGKRYLVLVSSNYIDQKDSDARGELKILTSDQFIEQNKNTLEPEEAILLDTIIKDTNTRLRKLRPEIENKYKEKQKDIEELKKLFLLNDQSVNNSDIKYDDTDEIVLRKVYQADARIAAKKDAALKKLLKEAEAINIKNKNYQHEINEISKKYVQNLPLQNRNELAQYIARRRILLNCIEKILDKYKKMGKDDKKIKEEILHNLIFQQRSTDAQNSDLWFISEEYIYYQGYSDIALATVKKNGKKLFKETFSKEEERYLKSLGKNRTLDRPDILLFPAEGKCIIIEFKALGVNVSDYLTDISFYAGLIANYSNKDFNFNDFYGYLIGESIEPKDVLKTGTGNWIISEHLDYLFRPFIEIYDDSNTVKVIGKLYTEVIKYSTLFERAKLRNKIFIDKLENNKSKE